jgi:hypothetical protein
MVGHFDRTYRILFTFITGWFNLLLRRMHQSMESFKERIMCVKTTKNLHGPSI